MVLVIRLFGTTIFAYEENQRQMQALSTKVIHLERLLADMSVTHFLL